MENILPHEQIVPAYGERAPAVMGVAWSGLAVTTLLVIPRIYLRMMRGAQVKEQDWSLFFTLLSYAIAVAATCLLTVACHHGLGTHLMELTYHNLILAFKYEWIGVSLAIMSAGVSKCAVVAYLLVVQDRSTSMKKWTWFLYFMAASNIILNFMSMFIMIYRCNPPVSAWNLTFAGSCYSANHLFTPIGLLQSTWNAVSDLILAVYPMFIVYPLQIPIRLKMFLCIIMGLGVVASAFSFVKLYPLIEIVRHTPTDATYQLSIICIWGYVELWIVLIALSIPPIWPLLKPYFGEAITSGTWSWSWSKGRFGKSTGHSSDSSSRERKSLKHQNVSPVRPKGSPDSQNSYAFETHHSHPWTRYPIRSESEKVSSESFV